MSARRKILWLGAAAVVLLVICASLALWVREPSYQGRSLSQWLAEFNRIPPGQSAPEAEQAIRSIGPDALPYLMACIWASEPSRVLQLRQWMMKTWHRGYRSRIDLCGPSWRALSILGPAASPALPEIMRHAADGPLQGRAQIALAALGTNSVPTLILLCGHSNLDVRVDAAFLLAKSAVNMRGLHSFIGSSPFSGQPMLGYRIERDRNDLEPLLLNLHDEHSTVRRATLEAIITEAETLRLAGPHTDAEWLRLARPRMQECLRDSDPSVRHAASKILNAISERPMGKR